MYFTARSERQPDGSSWRYNALSFSFAKHNTVLRLR
jgi:hypothetical protein